MYNLEAEKDEENDGKVIKNPMLHEYQTMLRYGSNDMLISDGDNHTGVFITYALLDEFMCFT
jgi:hypothetical protein